MYETNTCVSECPAEYKTLEDKRECLKCDNTCRECFGPYNNQCLSCYSGYFFFENDNVCSNKECGEFEYRALKKITDAITGIVTTDVVCEQCESSCSLGCYRVGTCKKAEIKAEIK
jgi:hypothetical protein